MLNGNLGHLRVSVGIVGFGLQADIADGEDVLETRKLVIFVDENASASSQFFILYLFESGSGYTTDPDNCFRFDGVAVIEDYFTLFVIDDLLLQYDFYFHSFQKTFCVDGGFFRHGGEQVRGTFHQKNVHLRLF